MGCNHKCNGGTNCQQNCFVIYLNEEHCEAISKIIQSDIYSISRPVPFFFNSVSIIVLSVHWVQYHPLYSIDTHTQ